MNVKDYISSGILESYVLGELSAKEKEEVEKNADEYPEVYKEIRQIKEAFYAISIQSQKQAGILPEVNLYTEESKKGKSSHKNFYKTLGNAINLPFYNSLALLALILSLITILTIADFYIKINNIQEFINNVALKNQNEDSKEIDGRLFSSYLKSYSFLFSPEYKRFEVSSFSKDYELQAWIFWNKNSNDVFLQINHILIPDSDIQFHLWGVVNNEPVSAGVFSDVEIGRYIKMKNIENVSQFLISLEQKTPLGSSVKSFKNRIKNLLE